MVGANEDLLRGAGPRVTTQRLAVLDPLAQSPHATLTLVTSLVQDRPGKCPPQTICDMLKGVWG